MCGYLYIQINYTHYTHIYYVNTNFYLFLLIVAHPTVLFSRKHSLIMFALVWKCPEEQHHNDMNGDLVTSWPGMNTDMGKTANPSSPLRQEGVTIGEKGSVWKLRKATRSETTRATQWTAL